MNSNNEVSPPRSRTWLGVEFAEHLGGIKIDDTKGQNHFTPTFSCTLFFETKQVLEHIWSLHAVNILLHKRRQDRDATEGYFSLQDLQHFFCIA